MMEQLKFPPMEELQKLILQSIKESDLFENEKVRDFTVVILDLFISKCKGLEFFVDSYAVDNRDMDMYFKSLIADRYDEELYSDLLEIIGDENV